MITNATIEIFNQGISILEKLSDEDYTRPFELVYGGTVGGHYRHVLEHFTSLYASLDSDVVNYDLRERNETIQNNRAVALDETRKMVEQWRALPESVQGSPIKLQGKISSNHDEEVTMASSIGRESAYAVAHAHHHFAIIGIMCKLMEHSTDEEFGVAPSTLAHQKKLAAS